MSLFCHTAWTVFANNDALVSLAPIPSFLANNVKKGHSLLPFTIPAWFEEGIHHPLCPVAAPCSYLHSTEAAPREYLFVWPLLSIDGQEFILLKSCAGLESQQIQEYVPRARMCVKWLPPSCFYPHILLTLLVKVASGAQPVHSSDAT
ncbi:hypothetical protein Pcinc_003648 [Petrolisthes cinctipes]|uniref:Uncharacterized protein n=1 Tax=Petrolisthes cinctipes TaxID=88211 RepID=A0AAE1GIC0_PETCI|nr:hypothetical protein Pcinc_003648 [Petrolisthes cinctipes]